MDLPAAHSGFGLLSSQGEGFNSLELYFTEVDCKDFEMNALLVPIHCCY